jgi:hypothetical protein
LISDFFLPALVAHSYVAVVAAKKNLRALRDNVHIGVKTRVYRRLCSAGADRLDFRYRIGKLKKTLASRKELAHKVCAQTKAHDGDIKLVNYLAKLIDMLGSKELTFVSDYNVAVGMSGNENIVNVFAVKNDFAVCGESDPRTDYSLAIAVVNGGLDKPNLHRALLVIEFGDECLCRFRRAHRAVFEIKLSHTVLQNSF